MLFDQYRLTSHGTNPWTLKGLWNVLTHFWHYEKARKLVNGRFTSVYRSPRVNQAVNGAPKSWHMSGLACDIKPGMDLTAAVARMREADARGELGKIKRIIHEPSWIHISWS
ncbi:MAG: hypothetical protein KAT00_04905 [Planctomycetes bacterium]|nr:hypothetical protein [Planctomycetota bacterium]